MRWPALLLLGLAFVAGCRNCDLVEAELRAKEADLRELKCDLDRSHSLNESLMRELQGLRSGAPPALTPEQASQTYSLRQITLGRQTGGLDDDHIPGDEALQILLEPRDGDGHTLKAPGSLHVDALEINPAGIKTLLNSWDLTPEQLRRTWKSGLFTTGYLIALPWKAFPSQEKMRVVVHFTLADGRSFEADKDITVRLTPLAQRKPRPMIEVPDVPTPSVVEPGKEVPMPRKVPEPGKDAPNKPWWDAPPGSSNPGVIQSSYQWQPKSLVDLHEKVILERPVAIFVPTSGREQP